VTKELQVIRVRKAIKGLRVTLDQHLTYRAPKERRVKKDVMAAVAQKVTKVTKDKKVTKELKVTKEIRVLQAIRVRRVTLDPLQMSQDQKVRRAKRERKVETVALGLKVHRAIRARKETKELRETKELKVTRVTKV
jgi:hypothetical protein